MLETIRSGLKRHISRSSRHAAPRTRRAPRRCTVTRGGSVKTRVRTRCIMFRRYQPQMNAKLLLRQTAGQKSRYTLRSSSAKMRHKKKHCLLGNHARCY